MDPLTMNTVRQLLRAAASEGPRTGESLKQHDAERPHVVRVADGRSAQHLWRQVWQGAAGRPIAIVREAGQTEIEQLHRPV